MLYFRCPTCKTVLADKELIYEKEMKRISNDLKLSEAQQNDEKRKLLDTLELTRICCRARMLTYVDLITIVK
jgi:DNA-directed RNA polymerase subunit N (RpoN/RPB10)